MAGSKNKKTNRLITILIVFFITSVFIASASWAETYKDTQWYKDIPASGKTPAMEEVYKKSYTAEQKVKALPAIKGGTVGEYLDEQASVPAIKDAGWYTYSEGGGTRIERVMYLGRLQVIYRWRVEVDGTVKAVNGKALSITKP